VHRNACRGEFYHLRFRCRRSSPHNIRVNLVSPGIIDTRRDNPEWYRAHMQSAVGIPLGRQGTVEEIATTYLFLVSDDSDFITGQTFHVNCGSAYYWSLFPLDE
jgi:3-oxoacyl-[acyl-carrier protein] reductase